MAKLAINGGPKVRTELFPPYIVIGKEEQDAVAEVFQSHIYSRFLGAWHDDFYGGPQIRKLEEEWAEHFNVKHAVSVNSATSGLYCAVGAAGIGPGDEVIVSPYSMSASAVAPLIFNAVPVFADVERDCFCIDADSVESRITERTKAILAVDIMGQSYDVDRINALAKKHHLTVIEDCAQAPGATFRNKWAGTLGDVGIYSLNYHKHIHTGEGSLVVTDNDELAERIRLIRNHAESVVGPKGTANLINMVGFNMRMTEIEAAMAREQLKKLDALIAQRLENVQYLTEKLKTIPCLIPPVTRPNATHVYYQHALTFNAEAAGVHRDKFAEAVKAELPAIKLRETEGVKIGCGYVKPIYLQPMFQQRVAYGDKGCPWSCGFYKGSVSYQKGICPVVEDLHFNTLLNHELMRPGMSKNDLDDIVNAFTKVWENKEELQEERK